MVDAISFVRSDEQTMLAQTLREMLIGSLDMDSIRELSLTRDAFDRKTWQILADMGLVGLMVPEEFGGAGSTFTDMAIVFEELGRVVAPVPLLSSVMASMAILTAGTSDQQQRLLPSLAEGTRIGTLAAFEGPHDDPYLTPQTHAERTNGGWRVHGTKRYVTDAMACDLFVVTASIDGAVGLFVVPADATGLDREPMAALDPTRPLGQVAFDVVVDDDALLGGAAHPEAVRRTIDAGVVAMAQEQVGGAQRCLEMSVEYAKARYQFGRAIGSFQAIKHRCADMLVSVEHARSVARYASMAWDEPTEAAIAVPLARSVCSDAYLRVAGDSIQIHGGIGFTWEHDAHLYFKRAKASSLLLGSVGTFRDRLGDAIGV